MMRGTLHLMAAADYLSLRGALQPALTAGLQSITRARGLADEDLPRVIEAAARFFAADGPPRTFEEARQALASEFAGLDERALGYAARMALPLVMTPDGEDAPYGFSATQPRFTTVERWLGKALKGDADARPLVRRYLAAFGPATAADAQAWSGLGKLKPVMESMRPELAVFRDEAGRELFDLPDAPRPGENTAAPPVRFLPGFDNAILAHADRSRIIADEYRPRVTTKNLQVLPVVLVDGFVAGTWETGAKKKDPAVSVHLFHKIGRKGESAVEEEGQGLADFLGLPGAVRVAAAPESHGGQPAVS